MHISSPPCLQCVSSRWIVSARQHPFKEINSQPHLSYVVSLLANLNARSYAYHPTTPDQAPGVDNTSIAHSSTLRYNPGQPQNRDGNGVRSAGTGVLPFIRSIVHTIHRDLTETPAERTSRMEREAQMANFEEEAHSEESGSSRGEVSDLSLTPVFTVCGLASRF